MLSQSASSLAPEENIEYPVLVLTQQPDSHNFNERRLVLNDTIKVGRSVARARPCESNAIFDCKVLSRNHAIFWFDSGKVWLKDTKSSNGTFVNSQLLSKGTEDSAPREIYSGDIIQFGVEVVENTTTHGCIIAQTTIFLSDGNELRRHSDMGGVPSGNIPISNYYEEQIYQLAQYIQEASHREQTLEKKLNNLSQLIIDTQEASDSSWKVILNQDRLMEKLELLQEQVDMHAKGDDHDSLEVELRRVLEQRYGLERESKSLLEGLIREKAEVLQRVVDLEQSLGASEEECSQLRLTLETLQSEQGQINERLSSGKDEVECLQKKLHDEKLEHDNEINRLSSDREVMTTRYNQLCQEVEDLRAKLDEAEQELTHDRNVVNEEKMDSFRIPQDLIDHLSDGQLNLDLDYNVVAHPLVSEILALCNFDYQENTDISHDNTSKLIPHFVKSHQELRTSMELTGLLRDELERLRQLVQPGQDILCEMDGFLDKIADSQARTKSLLLQIPEALLLCAGGHVDAGCNFGMQTDLTIFTNSYVQQDTEVDSQGVQVDLGPSEETVGTALEQLRCERKVTETLKLDLLRLQDENKQLEKSSSELCDVVKQLRLEVSESRQEMETRRDSGGYGHLFQESEDLRHRVQEIEEEMSQKRREYDLLYAQYETLIANQNASGEATRVGELEELCSRQQSELEELRDSVGSKYQTIVARSRKISALSVVPLCVLLLGIIISILSFLARPWLLTPRGPSPP